ncbi:MAG: hypothetical protein EA360_01260 [Balneolaceae bacterium]|nr:MAG: hypothetical protein EA360_01260 [Balneolaceae bacterium]
MDIKEKEQELRAVFLKEKEELKKAYGEILEKLKTEGDRLQVDLRKEYDHAKKYVKEHPETSVGAALAGGLLVGLLIAKLLKK